MKIRNITLAFTVLLAVAIASAQTVTNVTAEQVGKTIHVSYDLDKQANISLFVSTNGGSTYIQLYRASGDVGKNIPAGHKTIVWDVLAEREKLVGDNIVFKVRAQVEDYNTDEEPPMMFTEEMPEFPGGPEALNAFLTREILYPDSARTIGVTGTVIIEFVVEKDGRVSNAKVKVPLFPECDKEAVRVVMAMPKWKPGKNLGKPVRCFYQVPVTFRQ